MTFITGASLLLPAGSSIQSVGDLSGKKVAVAEGTTTETELRNKLQQGLIDAKVLPVKDHDAGIKMLEKGQFDGTGDQPVLIGLARAAKDPNKFALAPEIFTYEPYALLSAATTQISGWSPTARWRNRIGPGRSRRCTTSGSATGAAD